jgi:hypothetical protein
MAGMITSFWSAVPNLTAVEVVQFVKESSDRFTIPTNQFGYGIPDFQLALNNAFSTVLFDNETILIYPNPVQNELTIQLPKSESIGKLTLYNNLGQQVSEFTISEANKTIYLSNLASGLYFYQFNTTNKSTTGKLLKL